MVKSNKQEAEERYAPTLGMLRSQHGNETFPTWEQTARQFLWSTRTPSRGSKRVQFVDYERFYGTLFGC